MARTLLIERRRNMLNSNNNNNSHCYYTSILQVQIEGFESLLIAMEQPSVLSTKVLNLILLHSIFICLFFDCRSSCAALPSPSSRPPREQSEAARGGLWVENVVAVHICMIFPPIFMGGQNYFLAVAVPHPTRQRQGCQKHVFWSFPVTPARKMAVFGSKKLSRQDN